MAHAKALAFTELNIDADFTTSSPVLDHEEHGPMYQRGGSNGLNRRLSPSGHSPSPPLSPSASPSAGAGAGVGTGAGTGAAAVAAHTAAIKEEAEQSWTPHVPTPPISVPYPEDKLHGSPGVDEVCEYDPNRYQDPSPLDHHFGRTRRPSISFNPQVTLETGDQIALEQPIGSLGRRSQIGVRSASGPGSSELKQLYANAAPERLAQTAAASNNDRDGYNSHHNNHHNNRHSHDHHHHHHHNHHQGPRHNDSSGDDFSQCHSPRASPLSEVFSPDADLPRPTSLTSLSTASPLSDELRTPPDSRQGSLTSPFLSSPNLRRHGSIDSEGDSWPSLSRHLYGSLTESYSFGRRTNSLRQSTRSYSRKSPNMSGKSPASAFLSTMNREEAPAPKPDDEGQVIGQDYVIGKQIGFGGFSTVKEAFKVTDEGQTIRHAVKIVKKYLSGKSERENDQAQAEFDHEVRIWRYLNHPHILPLDAVYETDYATFCFTKLTEGGSLFDLVKKKRHEIPLSHAKQYSYQLACALRYLHEDARVVHRDIKLENCLLQPQEDSADIPRLILCDFGMAEWMTTDTCSSPDPYDNAADRPPPRTIGPSDTSTSVAGSLEYASPELLMANVGVLDPVVDIWAFGVVAYSLIVGSRPFQSSFQPRIPSNILAGKWDRSAVLATLDESEKQDREDALEMIEGCLEMDPMKRWTISDVLACRWFHSCADTAELATRLNRWGFSS
ncbi:serine/threonine-protein kinase [Trichophyton mentagrophytes]|uniref:Serine/threonine-protein kinase MARK2 n=1 Tax=Trichophyton interdigitale TaxID=101480 RepID=A0A9P5CVE2_9EURO|nr:Serine/threonine-protein kinase MARK2 [Trichophyton interdigitale]KAF3896504.1 Serine/threonine-protein kinase MARK2 [Trichophyton interdigitale]KAG8209338.1 Serine/threonine-protein kinase MARK2 [Trichophyton interdigitale]GBF61649.1 serine/threonine-protein kinase [Trichophyton mentagrophytes]